MVRGDGDPNLRPLKAGSSFGILMPFYKSCGIYQPALCHPFLIIRLFPISLHMQQFGIYLGKLSVGKFHLQADGILNEVNLWSSDFNSNILSIFPQCNFQLTFNITLQSPTKLIRDENQQGVIIYRNLPPMVP